MRSLRWALQALSQRRRALSDWPAAYRPLLWLGTLGIVEAAVIAVLILLRGRTVPPEGDLGKCVAAYLALGSVSLSAAFFLPLAEFSARRQRLWTAAFAALVLYSYVFEVTQHARGLDPRFSDFWESTSILLSLIYMLTSQGYVLLFSLLLGCLLRRSSPDLLLLGARYGLLSMLLGFSVGYWMFAGYQGRQVGAAGDISVVHGVAMHGAQVLPLSAWFLRRRGPVPPLVRRLFHVAALAWLLGVIFLGVQTAQGAGPLHPTSALAGTALGLAVCALALVFAEQARVRGPLARHLRLTPALLVLALLCIAVLGWAGPPSAGVSAATPATGSAVPCLSYPASVAPPLHAARGVAFVPVPGGVAIGGCAARDSRCEADERRQHVEVPPFYLAQTETTQGAYDACVAAGHCSPKDRTFTCHLAEAGPERPVVCISWYDAERYCHWLGGRLPTATEWEYAARAGQDVIYPWGDGPLDRRHAHYGALRGEPACAHPLDVNRLGLYGMAGNVREWTASDYSATQKELRGGSFGVGARRVRLSNRAARSPAATNFGLGFRCALDGAR